MPTESIDAFSEFRRTHIGRALFRAQWTFQTQFEVRIRAKGFTDFRPSDVEVIARLPVEGARVTELAERSLVSKQAIGKLVKGLEERGYIERGVDPSDGRAQRVFLSKRGRVMLEAAREVIAEIEAEWASVLTQNKLDTVREALLEVSDALGPAEYL